MAPKTLAGLTCLLAITWLSGCEAAKSANPLSASVAGPIPGVAITAPKPLEPITGAQLIFQGQRLTLLIENASTSGQRALWLQVEMASDSEFKTVVHQADRVSPGAEGRTSYQLPEALGAGFTYYWRARAQDGANTGPYSAVASFSVVNPVVIEAPTPLEPSGNLTTTKPEFKAKNGQVSGTSGVIYRFEVSRTADPSTIVAVVTAAPGPNGTSTASLGDLGYDKTYYWRAYGTDQVHQSPYSGYMSFKTPPAPAVPTPSPSNPGVPLGNGGRTPNPPTGQRLPLPNMANVVQAVAAANPAALQNSCQDNGGSWQFMDKVVDTLRTYDSRWGYNGKRGNVNDPSKDVVDYNWGSQADQGTTDVYIIDIINGHCGATPSAGWNDVTEVTLNSGTIGRWISRGRF